MAAEALQQIEHHCVAAGEDPVPHPAHAPDLLDQRLDLDFQRRAGQVASGIAEGRPRRLGQIVQHPEELGDVGKVDIRAAALEKIEQVGLGAFGKLPFRARPDGNAIGAVDVLQHGDRCAGKLENP